MQCSPQRGDLDGIASAQALPAAAPAGGRQLGGGGGGGRASGHRRYAPPELKVSTPAHAEHLGWHLEFEFRVTQGSAACC